MKNQTRNQKGFSPFGAIVLIAIVLGVVALVVSTQKRGMYPTATTGTQNVVQSVPAIQNANDLTVVNSDLDKSDLGAFDKELNQLDADASTF